MEVIAVLTRVTSRSRRQIRRKVGLVQHFGIRRLRLASGVFYVYTGDQTPIAASESPVLTRLLDHAFDLGTWIPSLACDSEAVTL